MAGFIPDDIIEEIRQRCDIVEVIGSYIPLKRSGSNAWKGCCPFHNEKTPSFHVRGDKQLFHCFGCGKGGDVFRFVMERENVQFPDAAHLLATRAGVIIPENVKGGDREAGRKAADARDRIYRLNEEFARFFENNLQRNPGSPPAVYLASRQLSEDAVRQFRLGAAPDEWDGCLKYGRALGFTDEELLTGGIVRKHEESGRLYDHFKGRLTFAIWNEQGKVVGFSARSLEAKPQSAKYVNTAETPVFKKGLLLYALPFARKAMQETHEAILCEGQLDTIAFHRAGCAQAVAPQGTGFTPDQAKILRRYADRVLIAFDADPAGQKAVLSALEILLPLEFEVKIIRIPGGKDPDELFRNQGADAVRQCVAEAVPWLAFLAAKLAGEHDLGSAAGCARAVGEVVDRIALLPNPVLRELSIREAATLLHVSENAIAGELARRQHQRHRGYVGGGAAVPAAPAAPAAAPVRENPADRAVMTLLEISLAYADAARHLAEKLPPEILPATFRGKLLDEVIGAALNGEHGEISHRLGSLLREKPDPEISAMLLSECSFAPEAVEKVVCDCLGYLHQVSSSEKRRALTEAIKLEPDPERRKALFAELIKLGNPPRP
ncbi:MAG: DNA primase [Victivallaceae bacterium]